MIDKIIIIFLVGFHGNIIYQMKEKVICYIIILAYALLLSPRFVHFDGGINASHKSPLSNAASGRPIYRLYAALKWFDSLTTNA